MKCTHLLWAARIEASKSEGLRLNGSLTSTMFDGQYRGSLPLMAIAGCPRISQDLSPMPLT
jgi:hypothetical protein